MNCVVFGIFSAALTAQRLDAERLALAYRRARVLEHVYRADIEQFLAFLDGLIRVESG